MLCAPWPAGGALLTASSSSFWFQLFKVKMAGSRLGWDVNGATCSLCSTGPLHEVDLGSVVTGFCLIAQLCFCSFLFMV